jgi:hypothetical protein
MRSLLLAAALACASLSACATQTPYQPAAEATGGYGYHERQIEANRYRIEFRGNSLTNRDTVENYLLYRAAELTLQNGKDYFIVANRSTDQHSRLEAQGPYFPHSRFDFWFFSPRHGWGPWYDPFWDDPVDYREVSRYEASAEIAMYSGHKPDDPNAYDAHQVQANLHDQVQLPPQP